MEAMRKQQAAFAMHAGLGGLSDDDDDDDDEAGEDGGATQARTAVGWHRFMQITRESSRLITAVLK